MLKGKRFQKKIENFTCNFCRTSVIGTGYTDHCPKCLLSKHVDINPGDRKSKCKGTMKPIRAEFKSKKYIIYYKCLKCGYEHRIKTAPEDNFKEILKLFQP